MWKKKIPIMTVLVFMCLFCTLSGCGTSNTVNMLNERMNSMNFEEAIQRFGPPTNYAEAGRTKVCTWVYGSGGTVYAPVGNMIVGVPTDAPSAQLTFTDGVMTYWRLKGNWD